MYRSRRELSNEKLLAKFGFDPAENEPCKVCPIELAGAWHRRRHGELPRAATRRAAAEEAAAGAGSRVSFDDRADGGRARGSYRGDLDDSARWRRSRASPPPADAAGLDDSLHSLGLDGSGHSSGSGHSFGLDHSGHSLGLSGLAPDAMDASIHAPRHFLFADLAAGGEADDEPPSI